MRVARMQKHEVSVSEAARRRIAGGSQGAGADFETTNRQHS